MKDKEYIVNPDEYLKTGTLWIAFNKSKNNILHFDSLGAKKLLK